MHLDLLFRGAISQRDELREAMAAGVPIGVVAEKLATVDILLGLPLYMDRGGFVLADSGNWATRLGGEPLDYERILRVYDKLAGVTHRPSNLYVMAPASAGDQVATLALLRQYQDRLISLIKLGANVVVPMQRGCLSASDMLHAVQALLGTRYFVAGIPCSGAALSMEDYASLEHDAFHLLGRVHEKGSLALCLAALRLNNPAATMTANSDWRPSWQDKTADEPAAERARVAEFPSNSDRSRTAEAMLAIRNYAAWTGMRAAA